jgi:predicted ATP-dependent protease
MGVFMVKELKGEELRFHISYEEANKEEYFIEENRFYEEIKDGINIKEKGFNIFIVDSLGGANLDEIISKIEEIYKFRDKPKDICYGILNKYETKTIFLSSGNGSILCDCVENMKSTYKQKIFDFYNSNVSEEKEDIIKKINEIKNDKIEELIKSSDDLNFQVKSLENGFTFIPVKDGEILSETNFNHLERDEKNKLFQDVDYLKKLSKDIIDYIDEKEVYYTNLVKILFQNYLLSESNSDIEEDKIEDIDAADYLSFIRSSIIEESVKEFSLKFDENYRNIEDFIDEFSVKIIADNKNAEHPYVIYQDRPSIKNLFGRLEYETINSAYVTDISMFTPGAIIKANEGCLIMNINDIIYFKGVYYYLKKAFINSEVDFDYNYDSNEILPLKNIRLDNIPINEKLVLIGDNNSFTLLKNYDEEFSRLFKIVVQVNPFIDINPYNNSVLKNKILKILKDKQLYTIDDEGITEIFKCLSRKIEDRKKLYYKYDDIQEILTKASFYASRSKDIIGKEDVIKADSPYEVYEDYLYDEYLDKKILFNVNGFSLGEVNGLSVIETAVKTIGRPVKITCSISSGEGKIYDIHKENNLSGKIHTKSISILKGYLSTLIGSYDDIPFDFNLNFEQVYSLIDGDSASVAEITAIISSLCKIGVNQNIAVTGSINQFGFVQPIGSVNEKIEGFYKVCNLIDTSKDKGVLIPEINSRNLILDEKIIDEVENGNFHIYTMETAEDAFKILLNIKSIEEIKDIIKKEYKKRKDMSQ